MPLTASQVAWYQTRILELDPESDVVRIDASAGLVHYSATIKSDESHSKPLGPEEYVHALTAVILVKQLGYPLDRLVHELRVEHGSAGSNSDEIDFVVLDEEGRPYAVWELKSSEAYPLEVNEAIRRQLFLTVPLLTNGAPRFIICATINAVGETPSITHKCIDYREHRDYQAWLDQNSPVVPSFPQQYWEPDYRPYIRGSSRDIRTNCTLAEFRSVATSFHNEFFSEHPDNQIFEFVLKCLLAKIHSEKHTPSGAPYAFQVFYPLGRPESAHDVANRVSDLYSEAYKTYIDQDGSDSIDTSRFAPERVKSIVQQLEAMALTKGSALNADIMGAFFEEILRAGFKQDRGMYFTHDNIARFMVEAVGLRDLTRSKWRAANHPDNRLPYVIDPACGSGTFLLHAMHTITDCVKSDAAWFSRTDSDELFLAQNFRDQSPNGWAKDFLYGFDPKFLMAVTAKLNMVLHGDGVAHLFKEDAYKPMDRYSDARLRPASADARTLPTSVYAPGMCEVFDIVISNPPFGVTLPAETRQTLERAFTLPPTAPTEALFIERAFQLLRPGGRLAVVLPESILNAADTSVRLFLLRAFHIRAVVSMPRHIFVDTPTLTSLLFAQKKSREQIGQWDAAWSEETARLEQSVSNARRHLTVQGRKAFSDAAQLEHAILAELSAIGDAEEWVMKRGQSGGPLCFKLPDPAWPLAEAVAHYRNLLSSPGFEDLFTRAVFSAVGSRLPSDWPCYAVDEVGFKMSKRGEKARENQLSRFIGKQTGLDVQNLHLAEEQTIVSTSADAPQNVLDFMKIDMEWQ